MDYGIYRKILHPVARQDVYSPSRGKSGRNFAIISAIIFLPHLFKLAYLMAISLVLGLIPNYFAKLKLIVYNWAALTCFRILSRSFSAVIRFHNSEFRPKSDGICVANHTTPIDVVILSCDRSYALVITIPRLYDKLPVKIRLCQKRNG